MAAGLEFKYSRTNYRRFSVACRGPVISNEIPAAIQHDKGMCQIEREWRDWVNNGTLLIYQIVPNTKLGSPDMRITLQYKLTILVAKGSALFNCKRLDIID